MSFDRPFYIKNQKVSGGLLVVNDESGSLGANISKIYLSGAYYVVLNNHHLSGGIQAGYIFKTINFDDVTWPDQFNMNTGLFDSGLPTGEGDVGERVSYPDINIGMSWFRKINILEPKVGLSLFHLNYPKESFAGENEHLPLRMLLNVDVRINLPGRLYIQPQVITMQSKKSNETVAGSNLGYKVPGKAAGVNEVFGGVYVRQGGFSATDAINIIGGIDVKRLVLCMSYDINISGLTSDENYRGAVEISFIYKSISTILNSYSIPCDRL